MRFISFANGYVNIEHITSIQTEVRSASRECVITLSCGRRLSESSSSDLSKAVLDKVLDKSSGFKSRE